MLVPLAGCNAEADAQEPQLLVVDRSSPGCSDEPRSPSGPYCTINAAAAVAGPGATVRVDGGTYHEQVVVPASGTRSRPITFTTAPGRTATITGRKHGFLILSRRFVVVQGFRIVDTDSHGIRVTASDHVTIAANTVVGSGRPQPNEAVHGIAVSSSRNVLVVANRSSGNNNGGILVGASARKVTVVRNFTFRNGVGRVRAGVGIDVRGDDNIAASNVSTDNDDSGLQFHDGARHNLAVNNLLERNGDHGIDIADSPDQRIASNTVRRNRSSGINVEGASVRTLLLNNIAVDNSLGNDTVAGNIRVTARAVPGTVADGNLVWQTAPGPLYVWSSVGHSTLDAVRTASGQEAHGVEADPQLAASGADISASSPAVDHGVSRPAPTDDINGSVRVGTPDIGAFEPAGSPPPPLVLLRSPTASGDRLWWTPASGIGGAPRAYEVRIGTRTIAVGPTTTGLTVPADSDIAFVRVRTDAGVSVWRAEAGLVPRDG